MTRLTHILNNDISGFGNPYTPVLSAAQHTYHTVDLQKILRAVNHKKSHNKEPFNIEELEDTVIGTSNMYV